MSKNLLLITSHYQREEFFIAAKFLQKTKVLREFDLIFHNNNASASLNYLQEAFNMFPNTNKTLIHTEKNAGYSQGLHGTLSDLFDKLKEYDNVIHLHCDVFILDENKLLEVMNSNPEYAFVFSQCNPPDPAIYKKSPNNRMVSTDIFVIRPKLLKSNIFSNYSLPEYNTPTVPVNGVPTKPWCEYIIQNEMEKNDIPYAIVKRFDNESWWPRRPCLWGCWHEHDFDRIRPFV